MKIIRLYGVLIIVLLSLGSVLVFAQDAALNSTGGVTLDYSQDRLQYEGLVFAQDATVEPAAPAMPASMETALVPCTAESTGPCDMIATKAEDIAGVWKQYFGSPRFNAPGGVGYIRYNADGTFVWALSIEDTAQPYEDYPHGTFSFDSGEFIIGPDAHTPPPCDVPPHYQLRVLKYGDKPVALRAVKISDDCPGRSQDLTQAGIWVAE